MLYLFATLISLKEKEEPTDDFTRELDQMVKVGRMNKEWKVEYMQEYMMLLEHQMIGREEGRAEGRIEGEKIGELNILRKLVEKGNDLESLLELDSIL